MSRLASSLVAVVLSGQAGFAVPDGPLAGEKKPPETPILEVKEKAARIILSADFLHKLPQQKVAIPASDRGPAFVAEGVLIRDLLSLAGVPAGRAIRGPYASWIVVFEALDGYRAVFSLAELDPAFTTRRAILTDTRDGKPLSPKEAPLRLVVSEEESHARWIRQIIRITAGRARIETDPAKLSDSEAVEHP